MFYYPKNAMISTENLFKRCTMSIKLMLGIIAVLAMCIFIFKKTVSGDAENDYKLRDILANAKEEDDEKIVEKPTLNLKSTYNEKALSENVYEQMEKEGVNNGVNNNVNSKVNVGVAVAENDTAEEEKQEETPPYNSYSTNTHTKSYNNDVYYEKINDDACEVEDEEDEEESKIFNSKSYDDEPEEYNYKSEKTITKPSKTIVDYIKTFWRGVTFTAGLLFSLYALYGFTSVHDSNDAVIYSIWLLAGVILLK